MDTASAADIRSSGAESRGLCKETGNSAAPDAPDVEEADPVSQRGLEMQSSAPSPAKRLTTPAGRGAQSLSGSMQARQGRIACMQ